MSLKHVCIPAVMVGLVLSVGCKPKPKDPVPVTAPAPIKVGEAERVLEHLRYLGVKKDFQAAKAIAPDAEGLYGTIAWFHQHTGIMGASLSEAEINGFGLQACKQLGILAPGISKKDLQDAKKQLDAKKIDKLPAGMEALSEIALDELPNDKDANRKPEYDLLKDKHAALMAAGVYRVARAVPEELWKSSAITIQAIKPNATQKDWSDVYIQYGDKLILQATLAPRKDGTLALAYAHFKVAAGALKKAAEAEKAGAEAK